MVRLDSEQYTHRNLGCRLLHFALLAVMGLAVMTSEQARGDTLQRTFPGATWSFKTPAEAGMDAAKLTAFSNYLGGRGCVVRSGYMIHTWGDQSLRADIASACKPFFSHFLFKALEDGRIPSLDQTLNTWEPRLNDINASLGYKDRNITWRHVANQTSCYGVRENPGAAFDYNDFQTALFFDTLFLKVYGATYANVDSTVLHPMLTDVIGCQDNPTFMIFGTGDRMGRTGISVRDHARFGLLYLNKGNWNGVQLISEHLATEAVRSSLSNSIPRTAGMAAEMIPGQRSIGSTTIPDDQCDHEGSYSWLWWTNGVSRTGVRKWPNAPMDTYGAFGHTNGKRALVIIPSLDIVVAWNDTTLDKKSGNPVDEALRLLVDAVNSGAQPMEGQIIVDPQHSQWFKRNGAGPFFMCGPGDPEGFLYRGTRNPDGTRSGDQMDLINKIKGTGANCIYMQVVRSHGGDGDSTQNPFINSDPAQGFDQDILNQWEDWFSEMDRNNITIFLIFYDDGSRIWNTGDSVGLFERGFVQGIVNRFEHHRNLVWCVAEEYGEQYTPARVASLAAEIKAADMHKHPVAVHKNSGLSFVEFADDLNIDQFAIQYNVPTAADLHNGMITAWTDANGRYNLNMSECADHGTGTIARRKNWAIAMGGAYAMVLGMDIAGTPVSDLQDCGRLVQFFESTNFNEMAPHDELAYGGTQYVLAKPGSSYIAYASNLSGDIGLRGMIAGTYTFKWFDCANGTTVTQSDVNVEAGDRTWPKPPEIGNELAVYIDNTDDTEDTTPPGPVTNFSAAAGNRSVTLSWTNPADSDFTGTMIRYKTTGYPLNPADGTLVIDKAGAPGSSDSYVHSGLPGGVTCYYSAFAHDGRLNYATKADASAEPYDAGLTTISSSTFTSGADGWTISVWKSGRYVDGVMAWNSTAGNPGGGMRCNGSGATDNNDRCNREGGEISKVISTLGFDNIRIYYDLRVGNLGNEMTGTGAGTCPVDHNIIDEQLTVFYSVDGGLNWTEAEWLKRNNFLAGYQIYGTRTIDLSGVSAANNNPNFALRFRWQVNRDLDTADLDNIVVKGAVIAPPDATILEAKGLADGQVRALRGNVITVTGPGYFYIQDTLDYQGIKVQSFEPAANGWMVDVVGVISGQGAERYIDCSGNPLVVKDYGPVSINAVGIKNISVGGSDLNTYTPGVTGGTGTNNVGLLVKVWGKVTQRDTTGLQYFYIDDGSGLKDGTTTEVIAGVYENNQGIRILADPTNYPRDSFVTVIGAVSIFNSSSLCLQIIPRQGGIEVIKAALP